MKLITDAERIQNLQDTVDYYERVINNLVDRNNVLQKALNRFGGSGDENLTFEKVVEANA